MSLPDQSKLELDKAARFRRDVGKKLGEDEDRTVVLTVRVPGKFAELAASLSMDKVIEVVFQGSAFQPAAIIVRGEELSMYLTDIQISLHLRLLLRAFEKALASDDR